jgi:solute carrier family 45, member 1/2/4
MLGTPYLLSLGLSKAQMSLVWLAGPLSGMFILDIIDDRSNNTAARWRNLGPVTVTLGYVLRYSFDTGRRRPFMVAGSILVGITLMIIGWTNEVASLFLSADSEHYDTLVIWIAVVTMYLLDFAINAGIPVPMTPLIPVQAACRAIIVDTLPAPKQEIGNAWASRMVAGGHLTGYTMSLSPLSSPPDNADI